MSLLTCVLVIMLVVGKEGALGAPNGKLLGLTNIDGTTHLAVVDPLNGAPSSLGDTGTDLSLPQGVSAIDPIGRRFFVPILSTGRWLVMSTDTGAVLADVPFASAAYSSLEFDPSMGMLFGLTNLGGTTHLALVDPVGDVHSPGAARGDAPAILVGLFDIQPAAVSARRHLLHVP